MTPIEVVGWVRYGISIRSQVLRSIMDLPKSLFTELVTRWSWVEGSVNPVDRFLEEPMRHTPRLFQPPSWTRPIKQYQVWINLAGKYILVSSEDNIRYSYCWKLDKNWKLLDVDLFIERHHFDGQGLKYCGKLGDLVK